MQEQFKTSPIPVVAVGFSPPAALEVLADALSWEGPFLSDEHRVLYERLGLARASLRRVYSAGTLLRYARAAAGGRRLPGPVEDTASWVETPWCSMARCARCGDRARPTTGYVRRWFEPRWTASPRAGD